MDQEEEEGEKKDWTGGKIELKDGKGDRTRVPEYWKTSYESRGVEIERDLHFNPGERVVLVRVIVVRISWSGRSRVGV